MEALPIFLLYLHALFTCTVAADTMAVNQTIKDGQTIVSPQQTFELGFFSPSKKNQNRYIGIWYKRQGAGTVIWVANRETPIANKTGELTLLPGGVLVLRDSTTNGTIWSSDSSRTTGNSNPVAQLLDSGNLMVIDGQDGAENYIWQSFDHPTDTFMPGMKFGRDLERGVVRNFTSWKSDDDPSKGEYLSYMDFNGLPQIFQKKGDVIQYRLGSWNGLGQTGSPIYTNPIYTNKQVSNEREIYVEYDLINNSVLCRFLITPAGDCKQFNWINRAHEWLYYWTPTIDNCFRYGLCGVYGSCDILQSPACGCLKGFIPKRQDQWDAADWTSGCRREIPLDCGVGEGFRKYSYVKLPDTRQSWFDMNMTPEQCEVKCRNECNCTAYTTLDIKYDTGCLLWYDELMDIRTFPDKGQDIYIRVAAKELEKDNRLSGSKRRLSIIIIPVIVGLDILLGLCLCNVRKRYLKAKGRRGSIAWKNDQDLPLYSLSMLLDATDNFSDDNKLGQGGFGPVYKGFLDGQEVAVKRLSKSSTQGVEEFKNEVIFISKLRHRNLVKILGCCTEEQEQILVYEYMTNKGLDLLLFNESNRKILDWTHRFNIINGIARGLLYLHEDSPLRIIHRDLKAANILLDHDMNPKISDFGLARSFGGNETETNTNRVVGTYGYMSPEYAGGGLFSVKSDVFSFGVLVLELVSGKKNRGFFHRAHSQNLLGHAWRLYKKGKTLKLVDAFLIKSDQTFEVLRSIHVGLLCVQHRPEDRPNMSKVVMMLSSDGRLSEPKQPGFYMEDTQFKLSRMESQNSNNDVTISLLEPR